MPVLSQSPQTASSVRVWIGGAIAAAAMAGAMTLGAASPAHAAPLDVGTFIPPPANPASQREAADHGLHEEPPALPSTAESVARLHVDSGLTWDQMGRLFGVSRRAVHLWASGKHMNARNIELLSTLQKLVASAPGNSPEQRRAWLFTAGPNGDSPLDQYMASRRGDTGTTIGTGYTPAGLLGMQVGEH
jgi:hypothetical protein